MINCVKTIGKKALNACNRSLNKLLGVTILPGTEYQKYALPLDYLPSRDYRGRWGYTRPALPGIVDLFERRKKSYGQIFQEMAELRSFYRKIDRSFSTHSTEAGWMGGPMSALDLAVLYYFVAALRPQKYVEIGSGISTFFAARAKKDHQLCTQMISIDPMPRYSVSAICDRVVRDGLETVELSLFSELNPNDIVFMDGSHRSFMNSDVTVFILDVLPILKPGVVVHFHDIHLPYDYPKMFANWYWNEQYILAAYLMAMGETKVKILMPTRFMSNSPEVKKNLSPVFEDFLSDTGGWREGGSLWFTKTGE